MKVDLTAAANDPTGLNLFYDSVNKAFVAPRAGRYVINVYIYQTQGGSPSYSQAWVCDATSLQKSQVFSFTGTLAAGTIYGTSMQSLNAGGPSERRLMGQRRSWLARQ